MELTRRGFFKSIGAAVTATMALELVATSPALAVESKEDWKLVNTEEYTNICCYCAGGCGSLCSVRDGELINLEGDPDHPINKGGLCPKGAAMFQLRNIVDPETRKVIKNPDRRTRPMVRRPGATEWEEITWEEAIASIARKVKDTRDNNFIVEEDFSSDAVKKGVNAYGMHAQNPVDKLTVNRCTGIASLGGSQENSEEEYLILKLMRMLGVIAIDNQARV